MKVYIKDLKTDAAGVLEPKKTIAEIFKNLGLKNLKGKRVFVKPNILRAANPDEAVITNPILIAETVSFLLDSGAIVTVGDNPAPDRRRNETEIAKLSGIHQASHGRFKNIGRYSQKIKRPNNLLKEIYVSREIMDCDILVSLPKFKTHPLNTMSIALKNQLGIVPGGLKPSIHALFPNLDDFCRVLLEIYQIRPPDVIIVDCLNIIDGRGKKFAPGKIIAGNNGYAVDYVCAMMAGINPDKIPLLKIAKKIGLYNPVDIEIVGELEKLKNYSPPVAFPFRNSLIELGAMISYKLLMNRVPVIDSTLCTKCLSCENVCPKRAVKKEKIDYNKCINCYCCIEVCPQKAIRTKLWL